MVAAIDVAIQRGGPPRSPNPPTGQPATAQRASAGARTERAAATAAKGGPPGDGFDDGPRPTRGREAPPPARASPGRSPALVQQSLDRLEREIRDREAELARLVAAVAREGMAREAATRHKKTMAALRKKLADARARATKARRALGELERGAERVPSSRLGRLDGELTAIEAEADDGRRALAALRLTAELAADEPARRLAVRSAEKSRALAYAEAESPSTLLADLAAAAADGFAPEAATEEPLDALGRALSGQARLARAGRRRPAR